MAETPTDIMEGEVVTLLARANRPIDESDLESGMDSFDLQVEIVGDDDAWTMYWNPNDPAGSMRTDHFYFAAGTQEDRNFLRAEEDEDLDDETLTVLVSGPYVDGVERIVISVTDNDMAPPETTYTLTASADMVAEGDEVDLHLTADPPVTARTEVALVHGAGSASADDYSLRWDTLILATGDTSAGTPLTATDDSDVEGDETG